MVRTTPVVTVRRDTPFKDVVARVRAALVSAVPVIDDCGRVIGMVSEADLLAGKARWDCGSLHLAGWRHCRDRRGPAATAATVMTSPVMTIRPEAPLAETARLMCRHRVTSLAVVDTAGRLIGIVSQGDLLDTFTRPDEEIQREVIQDVITRDFLFDPRSFVITVRDGIVTLSGELESDAVGCSLVEAVCAVQGVVAVQDHLRYTRSRLSQRF